MNKNTATYSVLVEGSETDDLSGNIRKMPFERTQYFLEEDEARDYAKAENTKGYHTEVWKLLDKYI